MQLELMDRFRTATTTDSLVGTYIQVRCRFVWWQNLSIATPTISE